MRDHVAATQKVQIRFGGRRIQIRKSLRRLDQAVITW